eukprot:scaffold54347_cov66-Phaeocystis_antarctica.AAC.3
MLALGATVPGLHLVCLVVPVGGLGVRACLARQCRTRASRAVESFQARIAPSLSVLVLELASFTLDARAHARVGLHRAGAALRLHRAASHCVVACCGVCALVGAGEIGRGGVRAFLARQRDRRSILAVVAWEARLACRTVLLILEGSGDALDARISARVGLHRAGGACRLIRASRLGVEAGVGQQTP